MVASGGLTFVVLLVVVLSVASGYVAFQFKTDQPCIALNRVVDKNGGRLLSEGFSEDDFRFAA
jgi:hypothetical protein